MRAMCLTSVGGLVSKFECENSKDSRPVLAELANALADNRRWQLKPALAIFMAENKSWSSW